MNRQFPGYRTLAFLGFGFGWFFFVFSAYLFLYLLFEHNYPPGYEDNSDPLGIGLAIMSGLAIWVIMMRATPILGTSLQFKDHQILITSWYGRTERITNAILAIDCNVSVSVVPGFSFDVPKPFPNVIRIKTSSREYYVTMDNKTTKDELLALLSPSPRGKGGER